MLCDQQIVNSPFNPVGPSCCLLHQLIISSFIIIVQNSNSLLWTGGFAHLTTGTFTRIKCKYFVTQSQNQYIFRTSNYANATPFAPLLNNERLFEFCCHINILARLWKWCFFKADFKFCGHAVKCDGVCLARFL